MAAKYTATVQSMGRQFWEFELEIIDYFQDNLFPNIITFLVRLEKITVQKSPMEALNRYEKQKEER